MTLHAPQIILLVLLLLADGYALAKNGEPKTDTHSFGWNILGTAVQVALLWWGGFFN